jgi:hypothetical protein
MYVLIILNLTLIKEVIRGVGFKKSKSAFGFILEFSKYLKNWIFPCTMETITKKKICVPEFLQDS